MTFGCVDNNKRRQLLPGEIAPEFNSTAVVKGEFKECKLSQFRGKYVVLFFYPLDFTFVCPTEIVAFSDMIDDFRQRNCDIVGCSTDSEFAHLAWINQSRMSGGLGGINYPLLADTNHYISEAYGVLKVDEGVAFRGLFIIDDKSIIRQITINDMPIGRSVDEVLRLVDAVQFFDQHGEVCPANWNKGGKTIKPSTAASKEYFLAQNH